MRGVNDWRSDGRYGPDRMRVRVNFRRLPPAHEPQGYPDDKQYHSPYNQEP